MKKLIKAIPVCAVACAIALGASTPAFAEEISQDKAYQEVPIVLNASSDEVQPLANVGDRVSFVLGRSTATMRDVGWNGKFKFWASGDPNCQVSFVISTPSGSTYKQGPIPANGSYSITKQYIMVPGDYTFSAYVSSGTTNKPITCYVQLV